MSVIYPLTAVRSFMLDPQRHVLHVANGSRWRIQGLLLGLWGLTGRPLPETYVQRLLDLKIFNIPTEVFGHICSFLIIIWFHSAPGIILGWNPCRSAEAEAKSSTATAEIRLSDIQGGPN